MQTIWIGARSAAREQRCVPDSLSSHHSAAEVARRPQCNGLELKVTPVGKSAATHFLLSGRIRPVGPLASILLGVLTVGQSYRCAGVASPFRSSE